MGNIYVIGCAGEYVNAKFCVENELVIGRNSQLCQVVYSTNAKGISGTHCKVTPSGEGIILTDLNSTNGTFLEDGTRLIPNVAVQLQNGQRFYLGNKQNMFSVLTVQDSQSADPAASQNGQNSFPVSKNTSGVVETCLNMFRSPIATGRSMTASNEYAASIIMIILQALMSAFFALLVMKKLSGSIEAMGNLADLFSGSAGVGGIVNSLLEMPYGRIFIVTALASAALSFVLAMLLWIGNLLVKNTVSYIQMINCVGPRSAIYAIICLLAIILYVLQPMCGLFVYFVGSIWGMIAVTMVMPKNTAAVEDKLALIIFAVFVIFLIIKLVVMIKLWPNYLPDVVKTGWSTIVDSWNYLLEHPQELFNEMF